MMAVRRNETGVMSDWRGCRGMRGRHLNEGSALGYKRRVMERQEGGNE